MNQNKEYFEEVWRLNCELINHFSPQGILDHDRPKDYVMEIYFKDDIEYAVYIAKNMQAAAAWIKELIQTSSMKEELSKNIHVEEAIKAAYIRRDFHNALLNVEQGCELSAVLGYGFSGKDLMTLADLHKSNKCRRKIEELLTDCNFHTQAVHMANGNYDVFF